MCHTRGGGAVAALVSRTRNTGRVDGRRRARIRQREGNGDWRSVTYVEPRRDLGSTAVVENNCEFAGG